VQLLLTALVTWFILERVGLGLEEARGLGGALARPDWALFGLSCVVLFAGYVASAAIWSRMVTDLGGPRLPAGAAVRVYFVANLGRYVPGKLWQIAGMAVLAHRLGVPASISTAAAVLGQAVALGGAVLVGAAALSSGNGLTGIWTLAFLAVLAALLAVALVPALNRRAVGLWFRLARRSEAHVQPSGATTLRWLALYTLNWTMYAAAFLLLVRSFDLPGAGVQVASAFAAAYVLGYAALFAPAGIGVREGFLVLFLSPFMGAAPAGAIAVVTRVWTTVVELVPAAVFWAMQLAEGTADAPSSPNGRRGTRPPVNP